MSIEIKNPINCELKLSPECLKIKTLENRIQWYGRACKICRQYRKQNGIYRETTIKKELDSEYLDKKRNKAKEYYNKNKDKIKAREKIRRSERKKTTNIVLEQKVEIN